MKRRSMNTEQPIELYIGHSVAFASAVLQTAAIDDRDDTIFIADQPGVPQRARRDRDAGPPHAERHRK